ncbi:MAG: adenylate/guanylate cyclase domain-containing protein [Halieaceae bacterium]
MHISGTLRIPLIDEIEEYLYDSRLRWNMPSTVDERIVIVDVDERSIAAEGHWPWQRDKLAALINRLFDDYQVRVVAFDMLFAEPEESTALQLLEQLKSMPGVDAAALPIESLQEQWQTDRLFAESVIARNVILGFAFKQRVPEREAAESGLLPMPSLFADELVGVDIPLYKAAGFVGNFDQLQQASEYGAFFSYPRLDDVTRVTPLLEAYQGDVYESLGMAAARLYLGNPPLQLQFGDSENFSGLTLEHLVIGETKIPVDEKAQVYIPFRGVQGSFPYVSATDILSLAVTPERLHDKLVFVGTSAAGLLDLRATPVADAYVGVEIHANLASGIIDQRFMKSPSYVRGIEFVQILFTILLMVICIPRLSPALAALFIVSLGAAAIGFNFYLWNSHKLILPLASVLIAVSTMAFLQITYDYFIESRRKQRLGRMFGQYIPTEVVEDIDESGEELSLEGESREMSVLFSDVRGFTTISESLEPRELTRFMNEFLTPITRIIHDNRGTIDKYMGDAVMAFWGAPLQDEQHAQHALIAALEMVEAMKQVTVDFADKGWPPIKVGIGISSGPMNVGNMGSEFRMAYTVLGDVVNLGSRLEGQTKNYGADILIAEETAALVSGFTLRELDLIRVKGKLVPITVYEPLGRAEDISTDQKQDIEEYHQALQLYRQQEFDAAGLIFDKLQQKQPSPLYELYLERIAAFRLEPPPGDWDGVFVATSK